VTYTEAVDLIRDVEPQVAGERLRAAAVALVKNDLSLTADVLRLDPGWLQRALDQHRVFLEIVRTRSQSSHATRSSTIYELYRNVWVSIGVLIPGTYFFSVPEGGLSWSLSEQSDRSGKDVVLKSGAFEFDLVKSYYAHVLALRSEG